MKKIAIIGLGYVGLPLAVEFGKITETIGFDIDRERIEALKEGHDSTLEVADDDLRKARELTFSENIMDLQEAQVYIITVPTPVDDFRRPDLGPLMKASATVGQVMQKGDIVIYESTVYPGATEQDCVPVLEKASGLKYNEDFFCGYSPERINPGDKVRTLTKVVKVTSGSTPAIAEEVDALYQAIVKAGTHKVSSMQVAEAAKVIENSQRDINIAFVNELAVIFNKMGIDTEEVLEAAGTKWNFLAFRPGLVGGHCIGVDPYYLTHKAQELGYNPEIILAGRRLNDNMGIHVANQVVKLLIKKGHKVNGSKVLVLGLTFKENCTDIRNTRVVDVIRELKEFGCDVDCTDPWANTDEVKAEYDLALKENYKVKHYDAVVLAVAHQQFENFLEENTIADSTVIYDIKSLWAKEKVDGRL